MEEKFSIFLLLRRSWLQGKPGQMKYDNFTGGKLSSGNKGRNVKQVLSERTLNIHKC